MYKIMRVQISNDVFYPYSVVSNLRNPNISSLIKDPNSPKKKKKI